MSKNKEENQVGINPEVIEVKITGDNPDLKVSDDFIVLKDVNSFKKTSDKNSKAFKKAQKRKAKEAAKSKGEKTKAEIPHVDDKKTDIHTKDVDAKFNADEKISTFRDKCKADLAAMVKISVATKSFKSKVYGGMILEWANSSADFIERVLMQTVDIAFIDKYCKAIDAFRKEESESFDLMLSAKKIDVVPFDVDKGVYSLAFVRVITASDNLYKAIKEKTPKSDPIEERAIMFFKWAEENTSSVNSDNKTKDDTVECEDEVIVEAVTEKTEDGKEEINFVNYPSTNMEFKANEKISTFRDKCKADLSIMVKIAVAAKSFKSKVYGGMILEWADSTADFIERVLMQSVDIAFIDKYLKAIDAFHKEKGEAGNNDKRFSSQINENVIVAASKLFKGTEEESESFNLMLSTKKVNAVPFDIDERIYSLAGERVTVATSKLFKEIEAETFDSDSFDDRAKTFFKWAEENTLFLMTDGPKGCKIGYRDCDGNIYDQHKKLFAAEVAA